MDGPYWVVCGKGSHIVWGPKGEYVDGHQEEGFAVAQRDQLNAAWAAGRASVLDRLRPLLDRLTEVDPAPWKIGGTAENYTVINAFGENVTSGTWYAEPFALLVNAIAEESKKKVTVDRETALEVSSPKDGRPTEFYAPNSNDARQLE